jgi:hypothetical protein
MGPSRATLTVQTNSAGYLRRIEHLVFRIEFGLCALDECLHDRHAHTHVRVPAYTFAGIVQSEYQHKIFIFTKYILVRTRQQRVHACM